MLTSTYFLQTSITFTTKVLIDNLIPEWTFPHLEYLKGMAVGVASYMLNTPLKNIHEIQNNIKNREHRKIGKIAAFNFIRKVYGRERFYQGVGTVNFVNSVLFYSLYFGTYSSLT
jgi:hypothetical protein